MSQRVRSALFVPASRPERFSKALAAGADVVIIDLEDAVEPALKNPARDHVRSFAQAHPETRFLLRTNGATTAWFDDDLSLCTDCDAICGILLPKAESAQQIALAAATGKPVLPIVESARGVLALPEMAGAKGVERLSFGSLDLMLEAGTTPDTEGARLLLDHIRCQILLHSAANGLAAPLDGVYPDFSNDEGLAAVARQVCDMGYGGMLCIHPRQIPVIHATFAPTAAEADWARRIVELADSTGSSAFQMDGKMVDAPVIERARRLLGS
jgi:(S)-citramalyl-CoA lyase